jgi:signal peptide peptidase SppA
MPNKALLSHLATRIFNTPLLIHPAKLDSILYAIGGRIGFDTSLLPPLVRSEAPAPKRAMVALQVGGKNSSLSGGSPSGVEGNVTVGIIPVFGTLVHRTDFIDAMSGVRSYESIRADYRKAQADTSFDAIAFEMASPGGEGHGLFDLVDEIKRTSATGKPTYAIVNEYAYSACYAIASACDQIFLTRTSGLGSIGVIARHADYSAKNEKDGVKYTTMFVGDRKNDFSQDAPLSDKALQILQESLVKSYDLFVSTVSANRKMTEKAVRATDAGIYEGQSAIDAGLADAVLSFDQALLQIAKTVKPTTGGTRMSTNQDGLKHQLEALFKGSSDTEIAEALSPLGYVPKASAITEAAKQSFGQEQFAAGKKAGLDQARELTAACELAGMPDKLAGFIKAGAEPEAAKQVLTDAQAEGQKKIMSTVDPNAKVEAGNLLVANAKTRAGVK